MWKCLNVGWCLCLVPHWYSFYEKHISGQHWFSQSEMTNPHSQVYWKLLLLNWGQVQSWFFFFFPSFILLVSLSLPRNNSVSLGCSFIVETLIENNCTYTPVEFLYHCNPWVVCYWSVLRNPSACEIQGVAVWNS